MQAPRARAGKWTDPLATPPSEPTPTRRFGPRETSPPARRFGPRESAQPADPTPTRRLGPREAPQRSPASPFATRASATSNSIPAPPPPAPPLPASTQDARSPSRQSSVAGNNDRSGSPKPYRAPSFKASSETGSLGSQSTCSSKLPCVAHPHYTFHQNCGCLDNLRMKRSPKSSPERLPSRSPSTSQPVTYDPTPLDSPRSALPPPPPPPPVAPALLPPAIEEKPDVVFEPPQKICTVPGQVKGVAMCSETGQKLALVADKSIGMSLRRPWSGDIVSDALEGPKGKVQGSVVKHIDDSVWVGYQDGSIRVYDKEGQKTLEYKHHSGAVTDILRAPDGVIYSSSMDCKVYICNLRPSRTGRGTADIFINHLQAIRCMAYVESSQGIGVIACGCEDGTIVCIATNLPMTSPDRSFIMDGHSRFVSCLLGVGNALWSGGDDGKICVWDLRTRSALKTMTDHVSGVTSMCRQQLQIWTLGRNGALIVYDARNAQVLHQTAFDTTGKGKPNTLMFHVTPVEGQVIWVSDAQGTTTSYYCPAPVPEGSRNRDASPAASVADSLKEFEQSEKQIEANFRFEQGIHKLLQQMKEAHAQHHDMLRSYFEECVAGVGGSSSSSGDEENEDRLRRITEAHKASEKQHENEKQELRHHLDDANAAIKRLENQVNDLTATNELYKSQLEAALASAVGASPKTKEVLVQDPDQEALNQALKARIRSMEEEIKGLLGEIDSRDEYIMAINKGADHTEELKNQAAAATKREKAMQTEINTLKDEMKKLNSEKQALTKKLADATAQTSQAKDDDAVSRSKLQQDVDNLRAKLKRVTAEAEEKRKELEKSRLRTRELEVELSDQKVSYESQLAKLKAEIERFRCQLDAMKGTDDKFSYLEEENAMLRSQLKDFNSVRLKELEGENESLKKQLSIHKHHITRLLENEVESDKIITDLTTKLKRSEALAKQHHHTTASASPKRTPPPSARSESNPPSQDHYEAHLRNMAKFSSPRRSASPHNPADPHHRANCVWCSGRINLSAGGTFGVVSPDYRYNMMRSPSLGAGPDAERDRSVSSPPKLSHIQATLNRQQAALSSRSVSAANPPIANASICSDDHHHHAPLNLSATQPPDALPSAPPSAPPAAPHDPAAPDDNDTEEETERRIRVLKEAHSAAVDQQVRAALVEEILVLHRSLTKERAAAIHIDF